MKKKNKALYDMAVALFKSTLAEMKAIETYTREGVRRDKIKFVSDMSRFQYLDEVYQTDTHEKLDVDEINNSNGIVVCSHQGWTDGWRYAYVKPYKVSPMGQPIGQLFYVDFKYEKPKCIECSNYTPNEIKFEINDSNDVKYLRIDESVFGGWTISQISDSGQQIGWANIIQTIMDVEEFVNCNFTEYEIIDTEIRIKPYWLVTLKRKPKKVEPKCDSCMNFEPKPTKDPWIIGAYEIVRTNYKEIELYNLVQHTETGAKMISKRSGTFDEVYWTFLAQCCNFCKHIFETKQIDGKTYYRPSRWGGLI